MPDAELALGPSTLEYAPIAEQMGRSLVAPEVFKRLLLGFGMWVITTLLALQAGYLGKSSWQALRAWQVGAALLPVRRPIPPPPVARLPPRPR